MFWQYSKTLLKLSDLFLVCQLSYFKVLQLGNLSQDTMNISKYISKKKTDQIKSLSTAEK